MNNPLVSIIVPCYNQAQYLPETLDSVLAQTYPYWECIIVNDGSPDNTEEIAKHYCDKDIRFKYVYKENGGLSSARNVGIKNSLGEFILPLDSDDLIGSAYLEKAIQHFINYPETKLVYCKAVKFGTENVVWDLPQYEFSKILFENIIFCSSIFRKSDYNLTNGYNENIKLGFEDWDFWLSLLNENDIVFRLPDFYFKYRIKENSMLKSLNEEKSKLIKEEIFRNHFDKYKNYLPTLIWYNPRMTSQMDRIISLEDEIKNIRISKAYLLGKLLIKPFSIIRKTLKKQL